LLVVGEKKARFFLSNHQQNLLSANELASF
jgi:hypothetical protein